jgi:hypothetical protein
LDVERANMTRIVLNAASGRITNCAFVNCARQKNNAYTVAQDKNVQKDKKFSYDTVGENKFLPFNFGKCVFEMIFIYQILF